VDIVKKNRFKKSVIIELGAGVVKKLLISIGFLFLLSGCTKISFFTKVASQQKPKVDTSNLTPVLLKTTMHRVTDPEIAIDLSKEQAYVGIEGAHISLDAESELLEAKIGYGTLKILDPVAMTFIYTPNLGFSGTDQTGYIYVQAEGQDPGAINLKITVENKPAITSPYLLVSRSLGCVMCHAKIKGSGIVISDLGDGLTLDSGASAPLDYFLGQPQEPTVTPQRYGSYGDHRTSFKTADISASIRFIVPKQDLPSPLLSELTPRTTDCSSAPSTVKDWFKNCLYKAPNPIPSPVGTSTQSTPPNPPTIDNRYSSIKIAWPTKAKLFALRTSADKLPGIRGLEVAGLPEVLYFPENMNSITPLTGLKRDPGGNNRAVIYNDKDKKLNCNGDVLITKAILRLQNLSLDTTTGCRFYVSESVFMNGPLRYIRGSKQQNLQITSSSAIVMGLGVINSNKCATGSTQNSNYQYCKGTDVLKARFGYYTQTNSLTLDAVDITPLPDYTSCKKTPLTSDADSVLPDWKPSEDFFLFSGDDSTNTKSRALAIMSDGEFADGVRLLGPRVDSSCSINANSTKILNTGYRSLLLNAPMIQARHKGLFTGMIITENLMWSMSGLEIQTAPVFTKVPLLRLLNFESEIIKLVD